MDPERPLSAGVPWWKEYLMPFVPRRGIQHGVHSSRSAAIYIVPLVVFVLGTIGGNYAMLSNENFFENLLEKTVRKARTSAERERMEAVSKSTIMVLRNPVTRGLLSMEHSLVSLRTLATFTLGGWLVLGSLSGRWEKSFDYWRAVSISSSVLVLGIGVHILMKLVLVEEGAGFSVSLFLTACDSSDPAYFILSRSNAFVLWFFWIVALRVSRLFEETPFHILLIFGLIWLAILLASFLLKTEAQVLF